MKYILSFNRYGRLSVNNRLIGHSGTNGLALLAEGGLISLSDRNRI